MEYEVVIGLETHVEQSTKTKMFCSCKNEFGAAPNTNVCEVCMALPGALPVVNEQAIHNIVKAGLATNCKINQTFAFDRKNYFYPDCPKAYQITQLYVPICVNGHVDLVADGKPFSIRIHQIHMEEDAAKLIHNSLTSETMVDFNRCGTPLMEIVTEPDFRSISQVLTYLEYIKETFKAIGISECRMERGQLRCDVNVSLRPIGSEKFGERTEMKNINSFKAIERAIRFEIERQKEIYDNGEKVHRETLRWDDEQGRNYPMRSKEEAMDYRYFPEPDLLPLHITNEELEAIKAEMPLLPEQRKAKYKGYGLTDYDADQLSKEKYIYAFFDSAVAAGVAPKEASNWVQGEIAKVVNEEMAEQPEIRLNAKDFADLVELYKSGTITQASAREVMRKMWGTQEKPKDLVEQLGLASVSDDSALRKVLEEVFAASPQAVADYKAGNKKTIAFFVGQVMKATKGKANAGMVNKLVAEMLD